MENYRHPVPRRGESWVHFAGSYLDSGSSAGSAVEFPEGTDDYENTIDRAGKGPWIPMQMHG